MATLPSFAFGDSPAMADELLHLVLNGRKTATCWAAALCSGVRNRRVSAPGSAFGL